MQLACPKCGTRDVRVSHRRGLGEMLRGLIGRYPLRCRRCNERWETDAWEAGAWRYARCPRCYRQDLTTWEERFYNAPFNVRLRLAFGAHRHRCAACRYNFASFRGRRSVFERRYEEPAQTSPGGSPEVRPK